MPIRPLDSDAMQACRQKLDALSKPLGALGLLEDFAVRLAGIRGCVGGKLEKRRVLVFAADNGIYAQQITSVPQAVTSLQSTLIASGRAGVNAIARQADAQVCIYDVGIAGPAPAGVYPWRVMPGTHDMTAGPAMTREEAQRALAAGREAVRKNADADVVGIGEMGICNTSAAAAVGSVLLGEPVDRTVGPGAGVDAEELERKKRAVARAIDLNRPDPNDPLDVVSRVGSLDLAAMAGAFLECAERGIPAVLDGCISACAALLAVQMEPEARSYLFASHVSTEPVFALILQRLDLKAPLDLHMRLGEGSGTPLMFDILAAALAVVDEMATLDEAQIDGSNFVDLREEE